jgi:hypothetical protein
VLAFRWTEAGDPEKRLIELLLEHEGVPPDGEIGRLLAALGRDEEALAAFDGMLLQDRADPSALAAAHEQAAAARKAAVAKRRVVYEAPHMHRPPTIDGRLTEDWRVDRAAVLDRGRFVEALGTVPATRLWRGPNDLAATLYLGWDKKRLYMAVDVRDDVQTTHDFDAEEWKGDCLVVAIDPEGDGGNRMQGMDTVFWLALAAKQRRPKEDEGEKLGGEHSIKIKEDESGTVYELALPWEELGAFGIAPGSRIGLNILLIDDDGGPIRKSLSWTPGLTQNRTRFGMSRQLVPGLFGQVLLTER